MTFNTIDDLELSPLAGTSRRWGALTGPFLPHVRNLVIGSLSEAIRQLEEGKSPASGAAVATEDGGFVVKTPLNSVPVPHIYKGNRVDRPLLAPNREAALTYLKRMRENVAAGELDEAILEVAAEKGSPKTRPQAKAALAQFRAENSQVETDIDIPA